MQDGRMNYSGLTTGQVVLVKAGREKGLFMLVCEVVDENYVLLTDGHTRKIISPKKKKIKHLLKTNTILTDIACEIRSGTITDKRIRNALSEFNNPNKDKGVIHEQK